MITASHLVTGWTGVMNNVCSRWSHDWANPLYLLWYAVGGGGGGVISYFGYIEGGLNCVGRFEGRRGRGEGRGEGEGREKGGRGEGEGREG